MYARHVDSTSLGFSLSSHRQSYIGLVFSSRVIDVVQESSSPGVSLNRLIINKSLDSDFGKIKNRINSTKLPWRFQIMLKFCIMFLDSDFGKMKNRRNSTKLPFRFQIILKFKVCTMFSPGIDPENGVSIC